MLPGAEPFSADGGEVGVAPLPRVHRLARRACGPGPRHLAARRLHRAPAPPARSRHDLAGDEPDHAGTTGTARSTAPSASCRRAARGVRRRACRWAARSRCAWPRSTAPTSPGSSSSTRPCTCATGACSRCRCCAGSCRRSRPIASDIKKPGVDRARPTTACRSTRSHSMAAALRARSRPTWHASTSRCCCCAPRVDHVVAADQQCRGARRGLLPRRHRDRPRGQLPRGDPRQRRRAHREGVARLRRRASPEVRS